MVTAFYVGLLTVSVGAYLLLARLPQAQGVLSAGDLLASKGSIWEGLGRVWFIFAFGFGAQFLIQVWQVVRRRPAAGDMAAVWRSGLWTSAHAGLFEEIIFRVYAFLGAIIALKWLDGVVGGVLQWLSVNAVLPLANLVTLGLFKREFTGVDWAFGVGIIVSSLFFRSAHVHYGKFAKGIVWVVGMVMFWLMFNYGLVAAILAHFLYDAAVFLAIALTSPLQPKPRAK
jgi:hypothetical protein